MNNIKSFLLVLLIPIVISIVYTLSDPLYTPALIGHHKTDNSRKSSPNSSAYTEKKSMSQLINAVRIPAIKSPAKAAVIFVHGLGDSGDGWSWFPQLVKQSNVIKDHDQINYVFPTAPQMPISVNGGYVMRAWFDIFEFGNPDARQDTAGFLKSCETLKELIKEQTEKFNIPPEKIIIGGFSQGAALSYATLSLLDYKIGGLVALSAFCPITSTISEKYNKEGVNFNTPIFQGHGTADNIIEYPYGKQTKEFYEKLGFKNIDFNTYPNLQHSASEEELAQVVDFINKIVSK